MFSSMHQETLSVTYYEISVFLKWRMGCKDLR